MVAILSKPFKIQTNLFSFQMVFDKMATILSFQYSKSNPQKVKILNCPDFEWSYFGSPLYLFHDLQFLIIFKTFKYWSRMSKTSKSDLDLSESDEKGLLPVQVCRFQLQLAVTVRGWVIHPADTNSTPC